MTEKKEAKHCDIAPFNILFQDLFTVPLSRYTVQFFNEYLPASSRSFSMILTPEVAKHWSHPGSHLQTFDSHILHSPHYDQHNLLAKQSKRNKLKQLEKRQGFAKDSPFPRHSNSRRDTNKEMFV